MKRMVRVMALVLANLLVGGTVAEAGKKGRGLPPKGALGGKYKTAADRRKAEGRGRRRSDGDKSGAAGRSLRLGGARFESGGKKKKKDPTPEPK